MPTPATGQEPAGDLAERPHIPPRRDLTFYLVLVLAVLPVWSIVPLSWAFVLYALHSGIVWTLTWHGWCLLALAFCEVCFNVYHCNLIAAISGPSPNDLGSLVELQAALKRVLQSGLGSLPEENFEVDEESWGISGPDSLEEATAVLDYNDPRAVDFRNYLRTWFGKAPWSSIHRHEMCSWLYWALFNCSFPGIDRISQPHRKAVLDVLSMVERRAGSKVPEGSNPAVTPHLLTVDPINVKWRPLVWYAGVALGNAYQRHRLKSRWDVKIAVYKGLEYVLRIPPNWDARTGPRPIVFTHGLGLGLAQYGFFLDQMFAHLRNYPVLAPLLPHVSQDIMHPRFLRPMSKQEMTSCLAGLLAELGWVDLDEPPPKPRGWKRRARTAAKAKTDESYIPKGVTMFSHSNGSFSHAWMLKTYPWMITRSCFVDPVIFCPWEGGELCSSQGCLCLDLCYNFIYKPCQDGMDLIIRYFVGTELGVANSIQRHFDWASNCLWYEEIPNARDPAKTMFFIRSKDCIIDSNRVRRYLTSHGVRKGLRVDPNGHHSEALLPFSPSQKEILRWLGERD
ncbi:hypothetical protein C2E23DRAFT_728408 [Lenzites betulinus]|nr:hypothetical protein C2E23DRAFT_728408 [Lenzites betulinus]